MVFKHLQLISIIEKKSNAYRFLNSYVVKWYEVRRLKNYLGGQDVSVNYRFNGRDQLGYILYNIVLFKTQNYFIIKKRYFNNIATINLKLRLVVKFRYSHNDNL